MAEAGQLDERSRARRTVSRLYRNSVLRYLLIGGCSFLIDFGILFLLHEVFGIALWISTGSSFLASFFFNYSLQRLFSFSSQSSHGLSLVKYIALVIFNTLATIAIVAVLDHYLAWQIGKIVATIVTTGWNYLAYRYLVFVDRPFKGRKNEAHVLVAQVINDPDHADHPKA
jgi:putative flippase GtrA